MILQVTPIVAIAPLIIIWVREPFLALLVCAWIVAFFPVVANTTVGLNSADRNLLALFRLYGASPGQTLRYLRLPTALPYFLAGLRKVFREGDPNASTSPSPVDFYSPDTFNYTILNVAEDGALTVETWGIPSYQQNTFPQSTIDPTPVFSFQIGGSDSR